MLGRVAPRDSVLLSITKYYSVLPAAPRRTRGPGPRGWRAAPSPAGRGRRSPWVRGRRGQERPPWSSRLRSLPSRNTEVTRSLQSLHSRSRGRSLSPRRFRRQSASPARPAAAPDGGRSRRDQPRPRPAPPAAAPPPPAVPIPVALYPDKEKTPPPRLIPINVSEEKLMRD